MRQESERRRNQLGKLGAAVVGVAAIGAVAYCVREQNTSVKNPSTTLEPTTVARQLELPGAEEASPEAIKGLYKETLDLNRTYFQSRNDGESLNSLRNVAEGLTVGKVRAMWASSFSPNSPFVRNEGNVIIFDNGRKFDLDNPSDFVIGTALVDYFFDSQFQDQLANEVGFVFERQRLQDYQGVIFWLPDNLQFEMGDIPPIARTESLEKLSQGLLFLQKTGFELPKKGKIQYFGIENQNIYENADKDTILLQVYSMPDGDFRAETSLTDYLISQNLDILKNYKNQVSSAFSSQAGEITEPELLSSSSWGYTYDDEGELPQILADYIYDGVSFRKKITYTKATGHIFEANILQAKYDYARQIFRGAETSVDGRSKEVLDYSVGDIVQIEDYDDPARPGIFLRETATLEIDPERPVIYGNQKVRIIEGPILYVDDMNKEATRMWRVQAGTIANGRVFVGYNDTSGWISEEWFGKKSPSNKRIN